MLAPKAGAALLTDLVSDRSADGAIGPDIQESLGTAGESSTYEARDTLTSAYDEALFAYYGQSQLAVVEAVRLRVCSQIFRRLQEMQALTVTTPDSAVRVASFSTTVQIRRRR